MACDADPLMPNLPILEEEIRMGPSQGWIMYAHWMSNFAQKSGRWDGWEILDQLDSGSNKWKSGHGYWYK